MIIVAAYIFLITSVLAVVVKIWTRFTTTRKLAWTDYAILLSIVCSDQSLQDEMLMAAVICMCSNHRINDLGRS